MFWFFISLAFLIIAGWIFIHTPYGQNWIVGQITNRFSKELKTKISIRHVDLSLFNRIHLDDVLIQDQKNDTLLYPGDLKVRITDWFFFKKKAELKYIGLENAVVKFQRSDSIWSEQFLFDYFSSPDTAKSGGIELDLKKVDLKNVLYVQKDGWIGNDMTIKIGLLNLDAKEINFSKNIIDVNSLDITDPIVSLYSYNGWRIYNSGNNTANSAVESSLQWNPGNWLVHLAKMKIVNGTFKDDVQSPDAVLTSFDGRHIDFNHINGEFIDARWNKDTITTHLALQTKERSGLEVKKMLADVKFTPQEMVFRNLDIHTNNSVIKNFFAMSYHNFSDMDDFIHKIKMTGDFDDSQIDSDDISFFAPELSSWKKKINLRGKIKGSVDELAGKNLIIRAGENTLLNGDLSLTGLPEINKTFIDFKANDFKTTYSDAAIILPQLRDKNNQDLKKIQPYLSKIQYVHFTGSYTGFLRDFVTSGTFETNLGIVKCDLNMKLPAHQQPIYSGNISTDSFKLGELLDNPDIGMISTAGVVKGSGLNEKSRNAELNGKINFLDYNNYRYTNIVINGKLDKNFFDGFASFNDPNGEMTMNGKIDFNDSVPSFNLFADVKKADLKKLNITDSAIAFNGKFKLDFTGDNLDDFLGNAKITEASLTKNGNRLPFDTLIISSAIDNGKKTLSVYSNEFDGTISGNFSIKGLPDAFKLFLNKYYPSYIKAPLILPAKETFTFQINTRNIEDYFSLLNTDLSGFDYSHISGRLDLSDNHFDFDADVPNFSYKQYVFTDAEVKSISTLSRLSLYGKAGSTIINDTLNLPTTTFKIEAANDSSNVSIVTGSNIGLNKANINAMVKVFDGGVMIKFDTTSFSLNGKTWTIDKNGELQFGKNSVTNSQLFLHESYQEIKFNTVPSTKGNWNDLNIELSKVNIGDFSPFILPQNRLEGLASGTIKIEDPYKKFNITANLRTDELRLDNDSIGSVTAQAEYNNGTGELLANGRNLNSDHKINFDLHLYLKDTANKFEDVINLSPDNYPIKILERFIGDLFSDLQGYATGQIKILGKGDNRKYVGKARLHDAGLKVNFTQCFYKIEDADIELKPAEIDLDGIVLIDPVTKNPIYLNGTIQHQSFRDMFFDLTVSTRKPSTLGSENNRPVLLLNTTSKDNNDFYGKIKGTGSLSLTGPESEMFMKIDAIASKQDSGYITIPSTRSRENGIADFLVEKKYGHELNDNASGNNTSNIIYDVDVTANPMVNFKVILDELTGDEIKGRGRGDLNIKAGTSEPLSLNGNFEIDEGSYLFTFQSFFKKSFEIKKGENNYIRWSGDPNKAKINFDAVYKAEKVSFAPLANSLQLDPNISRARGDVYVIASLTNDLFKPDIKFSLDFPASSPAVTDPTFAFNIRQIEKNPNDINKQVTYLIVFNSFAPSEIGASSANSTSNFGDIATNTISGIFMGVLNNELNKILSKMLKNDKFRVNFSSSVYNRNLIDPTNKTALNLGSNVNLSIGRSFFNDRFIITFAGGLEAPLQQSSIQQSIQLLPDVTTEWLINQSGTIRASFFYRENTDYLTTTVTGAPGRARRYGSSIEYRTEFDNLGEIFNKKNNRKKEKLHRQKQEQSKDQK